jgi:hypothetical protein
MMCLMQFGRLTHDQAMSSIRTLGETLLTELASL